MASDGIAGRWLRNVLVGIDQLANTIAGGDPDETISSRAAKRRSTCKACDWLCRLLEKIDPRHCAESLEADEGKEAVIG